MKSFKVWVNGEVAPDITAETLQYAKEIAQNKYQDKSIEVEG